MFHELSLPFGRFRPPSAFRPLVFLFRPPGGDILPTLRNTALDDFNGNG